MRPLRQKSRRFWRPRGEARLITRAFARCRHFLPALSNVVALIFPCHTDEIAETQLGSLLPHLRRLKLTGEQIASGGYLIADRLIPFSALYRHAGENRHTIINIVVDDHLALGVVKAMEAPRVLG